MVFLSLVVIHDHLVSFDCLHDNQSGDEDQENDRSFKSLESRVLQWIDWICSWRNRIWDFSSIVFGFFDWKVRSVYCWLMFPLNARIG